jgi:hypothetical protein
VSDQQERDIDVENRRARVERTLADQGGANSPLLVGRLSVRHAQSVLRTPAHASCCSGRKLALLFLKPASDFPVAAAHLMRHPPDVDGGEAADDANMDGRRIGAAQIAAPVAPATHDGDSGDIDADAFGDIYVEVPEADHSRHCCFWLLDFGLAKVEIEVGEHRNGQRSASESQPSAPFRIAEDRRSDSCGLPTRVEIRSSIWGKALARLDQLCSGARSVRSCDPFGELVERQPSVEKVLAQGEHHLLSLGVRDAIGEIRHIPPASFAAETLIGRLPAGERFGRHS